MRFFGLGAVMVVAMACGGQGVGTPAQPTVMLGSSDGTAGVPPGPSVDVLAHMFTWHAKDASRNDWNRASTIPWRSDGNGIGYASEDRTVIAEQVVELRQYGITPLISWRGPDSDRGGDTFLTAWRSVATDLPAAILYEGEARLRRGRDGWWSVDTAENARILRSDLTHLYERYVVPNPELWYTRHGKVVVYLWPGHAMRGDLASVLGSLAFRERLYVVTTEFDGLRSPIESRIEMLAGVDAVTGYGFYSKPLMEEYATDPTTGAVPLSDDLIARYRDVSRSWRDFLEERLPDVELILPLELAFDDSLMPYRDNPTYEATPQQAEKLIVELRELIEESWTRCGNVVPAITMPSYNEHYEGTALEPTDRFGRQWIELVSRAFMDERLPSSQCG